MADKDLQIKIGGDASGFGKAANEVTRQINGIRDNIRNLPREAIRSAGAQLAAFFSVDFLVRQVSQVVEYAGAISDMAARVGVATDFLQEADFAARQTGAALGDVVAGLRELQRSQAAAMANGSSSDANAFAALGISLEEVRRLGAEELFRRVARAIQEGEASGRQMEAVMQVLGRSATTLLPAMRQGFSDFAAQAREAGLVIEEDLIQKLDEAGDRMDVVAARMRTGFAWIGGKLADGWIWAANRLEGVVQGAIGALDAFRSTGSGKAAGDAFTRSFQSTLEGFAQEQAAIDKQKAQERANRKGPIPEASFAAPKGKSSANLAGQASADALQRIGLFINGSAQIELMRRQITVSERILAAHRESLQVFRKGLT